MQSQTPPLQEDKPSTNSEKSASTNTIAQTLKASFSDVIVGQDLMAEALMIGLLTKGHILLEGYPGLAKTLAVRTLGQMFQLDFKRIQFTPDLLPSDLMGTLIYRESTGDFETKKGPLFSNLILADEINRAPAKVQSALLEAMAERQVTIGDETHPLPSPFLVLATQNPLEQEGTYPLPEAQLDRFMFKVHVDYPTADEEREIIERMGGESQQVKTTFSTSDLSSWTQKYDALYVDEKIKDYIVRLILATRPGATFENNHGEIDAIEDCRNKIRLGGSPRASLFLLKAAKANAFLEGREYVIPDDVKKIIHLVLRHRIILNFEAQSQGMQADDVISEIVDATYIP